jgi:hypothetical protein
MSHRYFALSFPLCFPRFLLPFSEADSRSGLYLRIFCFLWCEGKGGGEEGKPKKVGEKRGVNVCFVTSSTSHSRVLDTQDKQQKTGG